MSEDGKRLSQVSEWEQSKELVLLYTAAQTSPAGHYFLFLITQVGRGETLWWVVEDSDLRSPGSHPHPTQRQQSAGAEQPLSLSTVAGLQGQDWGVQAPDSGR